MDAAVPDPAACEGLLVLLPTTPELSWAWRRVEDGALGPWRDHAPGDDPPWGEAPADARTVVLVPSGECPARIQPRGQLPLAQALAAARLQAAGALDGDAAHIAVAAEPDGEAILVATTSATNMDAWLGALATAGLAPSALVPAAMVLPGGNGTVIADLAGQPIARSPQAAFAGEPELIAALGQGETQTLDEGALDQALLTAWQVPPLDLRQGVYAPRRVAFFRLPDWRQVARMAAIALLLGFLVLTVETVKLNLDAGARERSALAAAQKRFPAAVDLASAQALAAGELARRGAGSQAFSAPAAAVLAAMQPIPSLKLRDLGYGSDGTLRFQAAAPSADDVNRLLLALQQEGWQVTVPPSLAPDPTGATVAAITVRAP